MQENTAFQKWRFDFMVMPLQLFRSYTKKSLLLSIDLILVMLTLPLALFVRLETEAFKLHADSLSYKQISIMFLAYLFSFVSLKTYRTIIRLANLSTALRVVAACFLGAFVSFLATNLDAAGPALPRSTYLIQFLMLAPACVGLRFSFRIFQRLSSNRGQGTRTLVFGAGLTTDRFLPFLLQHKEDAIKVLGLIDDDPAKKGSEVQGVKVLGGMGILPKVVKSLQIEQVILSAPSLTGARLRRVVEVLYKLNLKVKILPSVEGYVNGKQAPIDIRDLDIEDLLRRPARNIDKQAVSNLLKGKSILVTGGGGSIGRELVRQIAALNPKLLVINDVSEFALYDILKETDQVFAGVSIEGHLGNISCKRTVEHLFKQYRFDVVFHACAYKHVPLVEGNVCTSILNNILSAKNIFELAAKQGVEKVVLVSSDKAVRPTNVMGATKRLCELLSQYYATTSSTKYSAVRFGNVLASSGSVIPLFMEQIKRGGPVTVTHPEITRYFMLIPEAVSLVLQASTSDTSGEIFVLNMGEPIKILDMAKDLIRLMGKQPEVDIPIQFTGLRPGEKMYEELQCSDENMTPINDDCFRLEKKVPLGATLMSGFHRLISLCEQNDAAEAKNWLFEMIRIQESCLNFENETDSKKVIQLVLPEQLQEAGF